ncbi:homoserine kinase [Altericista sp. CCNU0014]|uniref:homoserine kinase n=1 Tax=Altericista sp. CCNU0014 TaxID=3082949 RepID=UPI003850B3C6
MSNPVCVNVRVPATTANIGPGFDCLGAALTLYNQFQFTALPGSRADSLPSLAIEVEGTEADRVGRDRRNLAYKAFCYFFEHAKQPIPNLHLKISLGVPLARGLGSSATAIVGGLVAANALAENPLSQAQILDLAIALEGHPDNVAPALLGGCQLAVFDRPTSAWTLCPVQWAANVVPVVAIPDFELSTEAARAVLPQQSSYADAIFNMAHLGLLMKGLETGRGEWIRVALQDRLHQPFRTALISGFSEVQNAAMDAGAQGLVISGAGPTLLALCTPEVAPAVAAQIQAAWGHQGITARVATLQLDLKGAIAQPVSA